MGESTTFFLFEFNMMGMELNWLLLWLKDCNIINALRSVNNNELISTVFEWQNKSSGQKSIAHLEAEDLKYNALY